MLQSKRKILIWVFLVQILLIGVLILFSSLSSRKYYTNPVTSVDLVTEISMAPEITKEAPAPPQEEPEPEPLPEPEAEVVADKKDEVPPKKIIKKVAPIKLPESNLKERLQKRLSKIKTTSPRLPSGKPGISADDQKEFPYSWYNSFIQSKMYNLWNRPTRDAVNKDTATTLISFRVFRDGHIENIRLKESSGSTVMDESALQAVRAADPLPPLPEGYKKKYEDLAILFELTD